MTQYSSTIQTSWNFRIIIVGDSSVGKTSLLVRYVDNSYYNQTKSTIGLDYRSKNIIHKGEYIKLQLWDTAGQEKYKSIVMNYFKLAKSAIIVFDISNPESISNSRFWLNQITTHCEGLIKILVGNKSDLLQTFGSNDEIDRYLTSISPLIKQLQNEFQCKYFMISCKSGEGVDLMFQYLIEEFYREYKKSKLIDPHYSIRSSLKIMKEPKEKKNLGKKKVCC